MDFKTRKIRKEPRPPKPPKINPLKITPKNLTQFSSTDKKDSIGNKLHLYTIGGGIVILLALVFGTYQLIKSLDFSAIVFSFGKTLQTDEYGHTNIMLVGIGGEGHDGGNLTDTIIIASIDYDNKLVPMLSIPRDFYVISDKFTNQRINSIYYEGKSAMGSTKEGIYLLQDTVSEITGIPIHYYAKVDFNGFVKVVDSLGGVEINVEESIYDPYYPKGETIYFETFKLDAGLQTMDGDTALKFARSRKTTSDFDRAKRQQQLLFAIKEKALSMNVLTDANKIKSLYDSIGDSIDTNLSLAEIIELAKLSKEFQKEDIFPLVINDDPSTCGGLVYTPAREYFAEASVLIPPGEGYEYIHKFSDAVFKNIKPITYQEEVQILNGTKTPGLAGVTLNLLSRFCVNVVYYGNATNREMEESTIYYNTDTEGNPPAILETITKLVPLKTQEGIPPEYLESEKRMNSKVVIELGRDYLNLKETDPFNNLKYLVAPVGNNSKKDENTVATDNTEIDDTVNSESVITTEPVTENPTEASDSTATETQV